MTFNIKLLTLALQEVLVELAQKLIVVPKNTWPQKSLVTPTMEFLSIYGL